MKICRPTQDIAFRCLMGACPDTCCAGWEIPVDEQSLAAWRSLPDEWRERMADAVTTADGEAQLRRTEDGRCVLLEESGLCRLYAACGEGSLCRTCRLHPRFVAEYGGLREIMPGLSCPAWVRLLLMSDEQMTFVTEQTDELPACNDIDGLLFYRLKRARDQAIAILQDRNRPLTERVDEFLALAERTDGAAEETASAGSHLPIYRRKLATLEILTPQWRGLLQGGIRKASEEVWRDIVGEQVLVYGVFRFFLKGVYDGRCLPWAKLAVFNWLAVSAIGNDCGKREEFCEVIRLYSKEIEHCAENLDALHGVLCRRGGHYSAAALRQAMRELL